VTPSGDIAAALRPWFAERLGVADVAVADVGRHTEGWSWQTYTMSVRWHDDAGEEHERGFAVRREPEDGLLAPYDAAQQHRVHAAVIESSDVPMPGLHWLETDPAVLGMPFYVMDRVDGVVPVQWRGKDPEIFPDDETRAAIGRNFVDVLSAIHAIGPDRVAGVLDVPPSSDEAALRQIDFWEDFYTAAQLVEVPLLRACIGWLRSNLATSGRLSLVHGDYRIGNFMLGDDRRINAVFDWELAHVGDPVFDVAWSGMPLFRGRSPLFSQLLAPEEFLARYEKRTGLAVEPEVFRFWTVFGHLRASAPHIRAARAFADGRTGDLRLAAMGHQNLYILKQLAREMGWDIPAGDGLKADKGDDGGPLQVPLSRLFEGLAAVLRDDVAPGVADSYARSQISAAIELLANLATRVEWSAGAQLEAVAGARSVLEAAPEEAPARVHEVADAAFPDPADARAVAAARSSHFEALADLQRWLDGTAGHEALRAALSAFLLEDLAAELARLRSGMYRTSGGSK
jgi:aminoglycoside phosphotransferase (APT) family kinase protein